jgi:hypothetical protein
VICFDEILQSDKNKGGACNKYKGFFWGQNGPLSPQYEDFFFEITIFKQ